MVYLQTWMSVKQRRCVPMVSASTWMALTSACVTLATDSHPISRSVTVRAIRQSCLGLLSFLICKALSIMKIMSGQNKTHQIASKNQIHSSGYAPIFFFFLKRTVKNEVEWFRLAEVRKADFLTAVEACKAVFWPSPGESKEQNFVINVILCKFLLCGQQLLKRV